MSFSETPFSEPLITSDDPNPVLDSINLTDPSALKPDIFGILAGNKRLSTPRTFPHHVRRSAIWIAVILAFIVLPALLSDGDLGNLYDETIGNPSIAPIIACFVGILAIIGFFLAAIFVPFYWVKAALNNTDYKRAIRRSQVIQSLPFYRAIGQFLEGTSHSFAGNWIESEQALRENLVLIGEQLTASTTLENLGNVLVAQKRYGEAIQCFERAIDIDPSMSGPYNGIAEVYLYQGLNPQRANDLATRALEIKLNPQSVLVDEYMVAEMLMNKAWAFQLLGNRTAADETIAQAFEWAEVRFKPVMAGLHYRAAKIMHLRGKGIEARQYFHQAIEIDPNGAYAKLSRQAMQDM